MTQTLISIPTYPTPKREEVPVKQQTAVERSLSKPDAWAKPGTISGKVQVRTTTVKPKSGKQRQKKRDPRKIHWF
jgi:hypothetical protein